jgi:hypothetical protein
MPIDAPTPTARLLNKLMMLFCWLALIGALLFMFVPDLRLMAPLIAFCALTWGMATVAFWVTLFRAIKRGTDADRKWIKGHIVLGCTWTLAFFAGIYAVFHFAQNKMP